MIPISCFLQTPVLGFEMVRAFAAGNSSSLAMPIARLQAAMLVAPLLDGAIFFTGKGLRRLDARLNGTSQVTGLLTEKKE